MLEVPGSIPSTTKKKKKKKKTRVKHELRSNGR
jgi:hypothetical protein